VTGPTSARAEAMVAIISPMSLYCTLTDVVNVYRYTINNR
jgi:hypothetical protein